MMHDLKPRQPTSNINNLILKSELYYDMSILLTKKKKKGEEKKGVSYTNYLLQKNLVHHLHYLFAMLPNYGNIYFGMNN